MPEVNTPRLMAAAKEFNIGTNTLVDFLEQKGFSAESLKPTSKLTEKMYLMLKEEFQNDKRRKEIRDTIETAPLSSLLKNESTNELAIGIVKKCFDKKWKTLDLGKCGLVDEDLIEGSYLSYLLGNCTHIETLILSNHWISDESLGLKESKNNGKGNKLNRIPTFISLLKGLGTLICSGDSKTHWGIKQINLELPLLKQLDLSYNNLSNINDLKAPALKKLKLKNNNFSDLNGFGSFTELQHLELSSNKIGQIHGLEQLVNLSELAISFNQITKISGLHRLKNLEIIDLSFNPINKIEGLDNLKKLKILYILDCSIDDAMELEKNISLESVLISMNQISNISWVNKLTALTNLHLDDNNISSISDLEVLLNINNLILDYNKIEDISALSKLGSLKHLSIKGNKVIDVSPLFGLENLISVDLLHNPILDGIPEEVINVGWSAIKDRLLNENHLLIFNEVKVLLLGNPNVGKSNLLAYLETSKVPKTNDPTHGIQYKILQNVTKDIKIHCWDFGGQEYFHSTHQLFFSSGALHIIIWSKEDVQRQITQLEECFGLSYWIRCVERLIPRDSKNKIEVIVVENKIDITDLIPSGLNQLDYKEKYKNLNFNFTSFSLKSGNRLNGFKELLIERLQLLCNEHPIIYKEYLRKILAHQGNIISIAAIGNNEENRVKTAIKVFHNMGILLYFPEILPEKVFTKPQALLDLLYFSILGKEKRAELNETEIEGSIKNNSLKLTKDEVIRLLKHFNLIFQIPSRKDIYFVPQYLKASPTLIDFFQQHHFQKANIRIESDRYLMNLAMLRIFAEYGQFVKGKETGDYLFWKDGIVIEKNGMLLLIKFNRKMQVIELFADIQDTNFELQEEIINFIINETKTDKENEDSRVISHLQTKRNWENSEFSVFVSLDGLFFTEWKKLKESVVSGIFQIEVINILSEGDIIKKTMSVFDFNKYLPESAKGQMKKIFISYSKQDIRLVHKFKEHLTALQMDGKVSSWYCSELTAGSEWNYEIQKNFDEADIICFMISPNFMRTKYIHEHEIKKAFEKKIKSPSFKIVPIILDFCRWTTINNDLAKYTALPYNAKPVLDFDNQNMAWYMVQEFLRIMIEKDLDPEGDNYFVNQELPTEVKRLLERVAEGLVDKNTKMVV